MIILKRLLSVFALPVLTCLVGCGTDSMLNSDDSFAGGTSAVLFKIAAAPNTPFARIADSASLTITAPDMNDFISTLIVTDSTVEGTVSGIPAGKNRLFTVSVFDSLDSLQYKGTATVNLPRGATVNVPITLYRVGANAIINGNVVEAASAALVAYYPFSNNANDLSGNGLNGTVNGATLTTDRFNNTNNCYSFSGNSSIIVGHNQVFNNLPLAVSFWFNTTKATGTTDQMMVGHRVLQDTGTGQLGQGWFCSLADLNKLHLGYAPNTNPGGDIIINNDTTGAALNDGKWHHVVFQVDTTGIYVYLDNKFHKFQKWAPPIEKTTYEGPLTFGYYPNQYSGNYIWDGKIDDVRIYNGILSEIQRNNLFTENGWSGN